MESIQQKISFQYPRLDCIRFNYEAKQKLLSEATSSNSSNVADTLISYTHYLLQEAGVGKDKSMPSTSSAQLGGEALSPRPLTGLTWVTVLQREVSGDS